MNRSWIVFACLTVLLLSTPAEANAYTCYPALPDPVIEITALEPYSPGGNPATRYVIAVVNWADYPADLFAAAPDLPACGLNTAASRSYARIYDGDGNYLYGFCDRYDPSSLEGLWFGVPDGTPPPEFVYVELWDRACDIIYRSAPIRTVLCHPQLPAPEVSLVEREDYEVGGVWRSRISFEVTNWMAYPEDLWTPSPELPPCGMNTSSARSWVEIYAEDGTHLYGFCDLDNSSGLLNLWFSKAQSDLPEYFYVVIRDRACEIDYTSELVSTNCFPNLPPPQLELIGTEDFDLGGGIRTRYLMAVTNWEDYPEIFFEPRPDLPACGANTAAARAWVKIYAESGELVYKFCDLQQASDILGLWYAVPGGSAPPNLYIEIWDRDCDIVYRSNTVFGVVATPGKTWGALKSAFK